MAGKNKKHIMVDIETLGTEADSIILSIGAVEFTKDGITDEFYARVDIDSCINAGLTTTGRTIQWWLEQSEEARKSIYSVKGVALEEALGGLTKAFKWLDKEVWCNGLSFDIPILTTAYKRIGVETPWQFWNTRDYRTLIRQLPTAELNKIKADNAVAHDALADARAQAETLINLWKHTRVTGLNLAA